MGQNKGFERFQKKKKKILAVQGARNLTELPNAAVKLNSYDF
jgi:hypothetical protein